MQNIIKTIYDNSKNGRPSFNIKTEDGRTMYANEYVSLERGDSFTCDMSEMKTSERGNQYYNISNVKKLGDMQTPPSYEHENVPMHNGNGNSHVNIDALRIYVTGVVGRGMTSGKFSISDVEPLTAEAVRSFKKHLG